MASAKKKSEGIALLSIYGDEDDDMEDVDEEPEDHENDAVNENKDTTNTEDDSETIDTNNENTHYDNTPPLSNENSTPKPFNFGASTPQQSQISLSSPPPLPLHQPVPSDSHLSRTGRLMIVDYGHDEVALSPEAEEGEIVATGRVMFGAELQTVNGHFQEETPPGTVHALTPSTQATPQSLEQHDPSESDAMNYAVNDSESAEVEEAVTVSVEEPKGVDELDKFLPPPPKAKCCVVLQEKIIEFILLKKKTGRSFNAEVRNRKEYRNPDFLLHAVTYQDIDQIGSCFSKNVFDPHGYDKSDYYDEIEADMKREMERKEQEKKKSQKVEYISGGTQPGTVFPVPKVHTPIPGVSTVAGGGLHSVPAFADAIGWDGKVDGDQRNPLPAGGKDSVSAVGAHAALLSAANAGTGYTAFAQQRRREAEEKRSSNKLERS